jgi:tetratricopeptide (TPR) repeat protein
MSSRRIGLISFGCLACIAFFGYCYYLKSPDPERLLQRARIELASRNLKQAEALAKLVAESGSPSASWGAIVAAEAALKQNAHARALEYYQLVPPGADEAALSAQFGASELLVQTGRLSDSERILRELLKFEPEYVLAHYRLAFILNITGRRWEAGSHLLWLLKSDAAELDHLLMLGNTERTIDDRALLEESHKKVPADPLPLLGLARIDMAHSRSAEARHLLQQVRATLPNQPEAEVRWGQLLLDQGTRDDFLAWNASLSQEADSHPEIWLLRGLFWQKENQPKWAVRCFWEALRRDSELRHANYQLGQTLTRLHDSRAAQFLERADQILGLTILLDDLFHTRTDLKSMQRAASLTEQMGRLWEARGWAIAALKTNPDTSWARALLARIEPQLGADLPQTLAAKNLALTTDLREFPLPNWPIPDKSDRHVAVGKSTDKIHFRDDAGLLDGGFTYFQSPDLTTPGARIFETTGGGVGVIDYDHDHWPDLYFTQGCPFPGAGPSETAETSIYRDQLQRNEQGARFRNVTELARLGDEHFSQGVTAGDFDNDGFQDLYVANLGRNRLYHNQGDGTFCDVTEAAGLSGEWWTTSCLIADLNGDGRPDIYDVNYVTGDNLATLMCQKQGLTRSCSPRAFAPAPDQVWLNQGDGQFRNATAECGIDLPNGYGLGIIAANFAHNGRLSLFIANDEVPNFFFVNRSDQGIGKQADNQSDFKHPGSAQTDLKQRINPLRFEELGLPSGLGVDGEGASQACMGVAAGDADGDGLLDLLVTNFYNESNTLYRQAGPLQFVDDTRRAQLREPSFAKLGFGTQFLDADLDGQLDLVLTNGHIDDLTSVGEPYQMPPQCFRNTGNGVFQELTAQHLGPPFQKQYLGRGLARLDWNRDGKDDFCMSNIADPAVLATNVSETNSIQAKANSLTLRLIGRAGARDAIGTRVEVRVDHRTLVRELIAGDGYQASNERVLTIGTEASTQIESLTVNWLNGDQQVWKHVPANQDLLVIEGDGRLWSCNRPKQHP